MGANSFICIARRYRYVTAERAFENLTTYSRLERGRSYSGDIGMKHNFVSCKEAVPCTTLVEAEAEANRLINDMEFDKWGPAQMIDVPGDDGGWVFFGWAAS